MRAYSLQLTKKHNFLKIIALVSAYLLWRVVSNYHTTTLTLQAPLSFYNTQSYTIDAPEAITVTLQGSKKAFVNLAATLAIHINIAILSEGENHVTVAPENLFLPEGVKLVRCNPHYFIITLTKIKD